MKRIRGFSVIETVIVLTLFAVTGTILAAVTIDTSRLAKNITVQEKMQHQSRHQLDVLMRDVRDAQYVLTSYTNGSTTYQSNNTGTLILQAPSYDGAGNILASNDVMVYHLVGSSAPYTLNRFVVAAVGSVRVSIADKVVISDVQSLTLTYYDDQMFTGASPTTSFTLNTTPLAGGQKTVTVDGANITIGNGAGQVQFFSPTTLTFGTAPATSAAIDALYVVSPSASASLVTAINVDLNVTASIQRFGGYTGSQTVQVSSQGNLRNH